MNPGFSATNIAIRLFFVAVILSFIAVPTQARRQDVVVMRNGDHFTGDVKSLQDGVLSVQTDYVSGNIGLDWNQVEAVESTATYQVVLDDGRRLVGTIERVSGKGANGAEFHIRQADKEVRVAAASVVNIGSQKPTILRQLQGAIDVGYSFTSGNSQSTLNLDTTAKYRATRWEAAASFDSSVNGQSGASKTNRQDGQATFAKFLNRNSYLIGLSDFLHSSQQDLNLRTTLGGGYGRYLIRSTNSYLGWLGGVVYTHESFSTTAKQPSDQNIESVVGSQYHLSRFNFGKLDSQILVFPGLSDAGRLRITTNNSLTINLTNNFYFSFSFWDNFDSRPPVTARRNELGVNSGIGWSF
jgi:putative salt-induced outer membrane protein YdiY